MLTAQRLTLGPEPRAITSCCRCYVVFAHALPAFAYAEASLDDDGGARDPARRVIGRTAWTRGGRRVRALRQAQR